MRINATRTPLPPVRTMTASQLKIGDLVAGHTADGSYPFHVERADSYDGMVHLRLIEISHASGLTDEQHPGIESVHAPDEHGLTLELKPSGPAAERFYKRFGFVKTSRRVMRRECLSGRADPHKGV